MPPRSGGGASAPFAHGDTLREAIGAVTPLSQPTADSSPQGEPSLSDDGPQSLPLRGGGAPEGRDGEVCRRCAAAARQRPLHRVKPCSKLSVRQHLSVSLREPAPLKGSLPSQATHPKPLLDERSEGSALLHAGVLWEPQPVPDAAVGDSLFLRRKIFVVDAGWMHLGYNYGVW